MSANDYYNKGPQQPQYGQPQQQGGYYPPPGGPPKATHRNSNNLTQLTPNNSLSMSSRPRKRKAVAVELVV
ncbi:hypothetical protein Pst134EA_011357 [Puccinia striiformis f. sp. tritici]|uniref:hypothetical protein n=1 Tax=Puccinia striiformis f. sp. tritici TaxID=168172 RepID=UPI002007A602|nr:hypothetical protein Pst134EA_011357 [Puccinia striiformis f. sp. tritici]KAH9467725.1 hypothetical protein Pst134EA_011357 [Puccinia striiformis f. sp. tritici]